jgi:hypothetical protein
MTLIDGDRIVTSQLYDDEYEEWTEEKMSIIDYINTYTDEGVTPADDVLDKIRAEIKEEMLSHSGTGEEVIQAYADGLKRGLAILDKYKGESEEI